jgi:para-nitrobenzyl esterase
MYIWTWGAPVDDGILRAPHTMEIGFAFDNIDKGPLLYGTAPSTQKLAAVVSDSWVAFARSGDPNTKDLPHWPAYDAATRATMEFDLVSKIVNDPNEDVRKILMGA